MSERGEAVDQRELRNDNQQDVVLPDGDANANDIRTEDGGRTGDTGTLSGLMSETAEQDKVIIWGTDSQCDDPELAEFEMLECQELEAYLVEDGEDFVGLGDRNVHYNQPSSSNNVTLEPTMNAGNSREERKTTRHGASEPEQNASRVSDSRGVAECAARTECSSETDVFVSCLSTMSSLGGSLASALDTAGRTQTSDSWHIPCGPYRTISEDLTLASQSCTTISDRSRASQHPLSSGISTTQKKDVNMNRNSAIPPEDIIFEAQVSNGVVLCQEHIEDVIDEHKKNLNQRNKRGNTVSIDGDRDRRGSTGEAVDQKALHTATETHEESNKKMDKSTQADETADMNCNSPKTGPRAVEPKAIKKQTSFDKTLNKQNSFDKTLKKQPSFESSLKKPSFDNTLKKQRSFENTRSSSPSSLERRRPWGSPSRPVTPLSPKTTSSPKRRPPDSPARVQSIRVPILERSDSPQTGAGSAKQPSKVCGSSGIPKLVPPPQKEPETRRSSPPQKPKHVRPKIITYVRKSPQAKPQVADAPHETSTLPQRISSYSGPPAPKDPNAGPPHKAQVVLCSSNMLFDRYRQDMQRAGYHPPGVAVTVGKTPSNAVPHNLSGKSESFHGEPPNKYLQEPPPPEAGVPYRSPRALRPQLGVGAVTRQPATKTKGQRASVALNHSAQAAGGPTHGCQGGPTPTHGCQGGPTHGCQGGPTHGCQGGPTHGCQGGGGPTNGCQDPTVEQRKSGPDQTPKSLLFKPGPSGLRAPGFSALPPSRLAAFGFVRSGSVSSVSSNQSNDSTHSDSCRASQHPSSGSDDTPLHRATAPPSEVSRAPSHSSPHPPNAPSLQRRSLPPPRCSPLVRGRTAVGRGARVERAQESDRALVQHLRERCQQQAWQLQSLQAQLKKASLGLEVFAITTQHFCQKSESAIVKARELSLELARIRDEVAFSVARWEHLQQDKEALERRFESELRGLRAQQQSELGALEERLRAQHTAECQRVKAQQRAELEELRLKQREQIEEMGESHETSLMEMETAHNDTLATLQEEHARTVKNLKMAHEQQRKSLEEEFEKLRLSLQDQVDTLTFQNRSLRDRAKRFEEALRKSTDEQIVDALAPYQHIEEDLKSLKEVLEMKNQQIHQQDVKISELEKMQAEKNVYLEERVQVLQQQNEDLKARIDKNLAVSRQLSEENANLQVHVEKENNEKKRLSRTNEELLWRLQTGELSPRMSPNSSPIHRSSPGPGSPARPHSYHQ
ncbi:microtubule-associated tumor suppressor candidate 2-like [Diretmus argenteus]